MERAASRPHRPRRPRPRPLPEAIRDYHPTVVIDPLGGPFTPAALEALAPGGRHVVFGTNAGADVRVNLQHLYRNGRMLIGYGNMQLGTQARRTGLAAAVRALADGQLRIVVDRTFPLSDVNAAVAALGDRTIIGKIMLDLRSA